jgi:glycosyltransferase involved in cell wall biosynthesis
MFNDVLLIPDLFGWITGRWAEELSKALDPYRTLTCPSWFLGNHPRLFRVLAQHSRMIANLDPWFASGVMGRCRALPQRRLVASVLHHVNEDDPNAAFVAQADLPVAACEAAREHLAALVKPPRQVLLVENGVDLEEFRPRNKAQCRKLLAIDESRFVVGYLGNTSNNVRGRKGLDILERVMGAVVDEPNMEFAFCGRGWDEWCKSSGGLRGKMRHFGFIKREELGSFYGALDVLVITSRNEGGPASILEAMACGIPAVASRTGIVPKVVITGENGYCIDVGDVSGFATAIRRLAADRMLRELLGQNARATVVEQWGWQTKMAPFANEIRAMIPSTKLAPCRWDLARPLRSLCQALVRKAEARKFQVG